MGVTLAGVTLPIANEEICEWVRRFIPVEHAVPTLDRAWPGSLMAANAVAFPSRNRAPQFVEVNTFMMPQGASRYGVGWFVADGATADQVRDLANGDDGSTTTPITLVMNDPESTETMTTQVTLLKIIPLTQFTLQDTDPASNLFLLTVVDARYYWQFIPCPNFSIPAYGMNLSSMYGGVGATVPTWANLITQVASALGITIATDTIPTAYLSPDPSLNLPGVPISLVLDAICANIGMKLVYRLDGSVALQNASTAQTARAADIAINPTRTMIGGGVWFQDNLRQPGS